MPKKAFSLEPGGSPRLEIEWRGIWKETRIRLDGAELGVIPTQKALEDGRDFSLPAGGKLTVRLVKSPFSVELQVLRDGAPVPGSQSDPAYRVNQAAYMLYFIGAFNALLGALAELASIGFL